MNERIIKIVLIGPESTGKSTLCEKLAAHYNTIWVEEYAREFLLKNGNEYTQNDLLAIAKGQIENEEKAIQLLRESHSTSPFGGLSGLPNKQLLIIDTDMYVMKVWSEFVFNHCDHFILNHIVNRKYDFYLLCEPDIPWQKDELREYPDLATREKLYHYYKDILINQQCQWMNINGNYEARLQNSIEEINKLF
ncbi:MAG: ATP-binding protein [Bacteroidota bacterium]